MLKSNFPNAIIFDLDGTLIDSAPDLRLAINQVFDSIGRRNLSLEEVVMMIGDGVPTFIERAFHTTGSIATKNQIEQTMKEFLWIYEKNSISLTTVFPGVFLMLETLQKQDIKLGICTNKPYGAAMEVLINLGLNSFFHNFHLSLTKATIDT